MLEFVQWPAMAVTVLASWFVGSAKSRRRVLGFCLFLVSNVLWIIWAVPGHAYALVMLQAFLVFMNVRGWRRNKAD